MNKEKTINKIIKAIKEYLSKQGIRIAKIETGEWNAGEEDYDEIRTFIQVHVCVKEVDEMIDIWEKTIDYLVEKLGRESLEEIDVFFTRAK